MKLGLWIGIHKEGRSHGRFIPDMMIYRFIDEAILMWEMQDKDKRQN